MCLVIGDQNKHVGADHLGVEGSLPHVSRGGQLVRDLLATGDWHLVNGMGREVVEGGPFTREDPASGAKSCLQLFILSTELKPFVSKLYIDSSRAMGVARPVWKKGQFRLVHSDHYPCLLTLKDMPWISRIESKEKKEKKVQWNLCKKGGWNRYEVLSNECADDLDKVIEDEEKDVEEAMVIFEKIHNKVKFRSFGKVNTTKKKEEKEDKVLPNKEEETEEEKAKKLLKKQVEDIEKEIEDIRSKGKGRVGTIYEVARRVRGGKQVAMQPTAIQDPETGRLVVSREKIKAVSLNYCKKTLSNNPPEPGFSRFSELQEQLQDLRMEAMDGNFMADKVLFEKVLKKFPLLAKKVTTS